jgi:peptidoglycan/xylan/chitin deacetylase (PgdA/CDA1 family)
MLASPPSLVRKLYKSGIWRMPEYEKKIYLTFDDGPIPDVTEWVLDYLKSYSIKATFFCVGDNIIKHPQIFNRLLAEGHSVGNHTFNHLKGFYTNNTIYFENVAKCNELLADNKLFRPPYGQLKFSQIRKLSKSYKIILWDVLSYDYSSAISPEKCLKNVIENTRPGSIIVFHDSIKAKENLIYALPRVIEHLSDKGYTFDKI